MTLVTTTITISQTWTCPAGVTRINLVLVGAGGNGAPGEATNASGYGGGAGQVQTASLQLVTPGTPYSIVVGSGSGQNTAAFGITATGGANASDAYPAGPDPGATGYSTGGNATAGGATIYGAGGAAGFGYGGGGGGGRSCSSCIPGAGGYGSYGVVIISYYQPAITFSAVSNDPEYIAPATFGFVASATENPTGWAWTFGDGGTSMLQNPSHTYNAPGKYTVTLTVTNAYCTVILTETDYIAVYWEPTTQTYFLTADPRGA